MTAADNATKSNRTNTQPTSNAITAKPCNIKTIAAITGIPPRNIATRQRDLRLSCEGDVHIAKCTYRDLLPHFYLFIYHLQNT